VLLILILVVVAALAAIGTGYININQTRGAEVPEVTTTREGVAARGGQSPAFDVQTGQVAIGSRDATVKLPKIEVRPAGGGNAAAPAQPQGAPPAAPPPPAARPAPAPAPAGDDVTSTNAVQR
jgi:hypothetical protein